MCNIDLNMFGLFNYVSEIQLICFNADCIDTETVSSVGQTEKPVYDAAAGSNKVRTLSAWNNPN
jgi:hypothetical protein